MFLNDLSAKKAFWHRRRFNWGFGTGDKTKAGIPTAADLLTDCFSMISGATRRA